MMEKSKWLIFFYVFGLLAYGVYSFSRVDVNLTLFKSFYYQSFQRVMTNLGYINRPLATFLFFLIICFLFFVYYLIYLEVKKKKICLKTVFKICFLGVAILIFSYPALSYDIFNYIFNAKMVLVYKADPHIKVAQDFMFDSWTRFMHNIHTPAPYFYGWTAISLIPAFLGFGKFVLNLINFKIFEIPFFVLEVFVLNKILKKILPGKRMERLALLVLNPLVLIETFGNGHNDFVMMSLAMVSLWFLMKEKTTAKNLILSLVFLFSSASIKYVTIVLLPLYLIYAYRKNLDIGSIGAIILFLVIFTRPQDQFHPWYLIWSLSFAVISKREWVLKILIFFTLAMMLRYIPWIYSGGYSDEVLILKSIITYGCLLFLICLEFLWSKKLLKINN